MVVQNRAMRVFDSTRGAWICCLVLVILSLPASTCSALSFQSSIVSEDIVTATESSMRATGGLESSTNLLLKPHRSLFKNKRRTVLVARRRKQRVRRKRRPRYAYPYNLFLLSAPAFERSSLKEGSAAEILDAFREGTAEKFSARCLVRAGAFKYYPLKGGIYWRREPIKYIIMHSTETARPASAVNVIKSWSNRGRRHPGAQFVVGREGSIFLDVDPDLATVHVNIFHTLPGINNDNSIGIEMVHSGSQKYTESQLISVVRLVTYLQQRYNVADENVITHKYAQQGHHTDPVNFNWEGFLARKNSFRDRSLLAQARVLVAKSRGWDVVDQSIASAIGVDSHSSDDIDSAAVETDATFSIERTVKVGASGSSSSTDETKVPLELVESEFQAKGVENPPTAQVRSATGEAKSSQVNGSAEANSRGGTARPLPELRGPIHVAPEQAEVFPLPPKLVP